MLAPAARAYLLVPSHREAASFPTGKLHHFPLESFLTSQQEAFSLPYFPTGIFLSSQQESSSLPTTKLTYFPPGSGSFPSSHREASPLLSGSFLTSHHEAFSLLAGKLRSYLLGSLLHSYQEAVSLPTGSFLTFFKLIQATCIGDLLPKNSFFFRKNSISQKFPVKSKEFPGTLAYRAYLLLKCKGMALFIEEDVYPKISSGSSNFLFKTPGPFLVRQTKPYRPVPILVATCHVFLDLALGSILFVYLL